MTTDHEEAPFSRFLVPAIGIAVVGLFGALYVFNEQYYLRLMTSWMLTPFEHPFIDWQYVPAAAECWSRGVNVYVATPCYDIGPLLKNSYSPLLLRFSFLPTSPTANAAFGVGWALLFWAVQAYLPPARTRRELVLTLLVALSSLTAFAIERGNVDLIIFALTVIGIALWLGSLPSRSLAYAVFLLAGLLKYYPLILFVLAIRETPRVFLSITCAVTFVLLVAIFGAGDELAAALHNVPKGSYFTDTFGATNLPFGLPILGNYTASRFGAQSTITGLLSWISVPVYVILVVASLSGAASLAFRNGLSKGVASLSGRSRAPLLAGALLLCGCFFAGQSIGYRGIFLILLLPGLFELERTLPTIGARCVRVALYAIVFVVWVLTFEWFSFAYRLTQDYTLNRDGFGFLHWVLDELCWWWIVMVLLSILISFAAHSSMGQWARSMVKRRHDGVARS